MATRSVLREVGRTLALAGTTALLIACTSTGGNVSNRESDRLAPCPASPNCVSSDAADGIHAIRPLALGDDPAATWRSLIELLEADPAYTIVEQTDDYLRAEARTRLLRFVDDVEFQRRASQGEIAMRSASRLGYSDLGANRRRLEGLRRKLGQSG
ncbi:MAG: DUF1499 domain-containing protein [Pseudomonadales bacterium]